MPLNKPKLQNEIVTTHSSAPNDAGDPIRPTPLTSKLALNYRKDNVLCKIKKKSTKKMRVMLVETSKKLALCVIELVLIYAVTYFVKENCYQILYL